MEETDGAGKLTDDSGESNSIRRLTYDVASSTETGLSNNMNSTISDDLLHISTEDRIAAYGIDSSKKQSTSGKKTKSKSGTRRSPEIMFRVAFRAYLELTELADRKAGILIRTNGLILSFVITVGGIISYRSEPLHLPVMCLLITSLISMTFALFAIYPRIIHPESISAEKIRQDRTSLLFFGTVERFGADEYQELMLELIQDQSRINRHMIRELYGLGKGINYKFRLVKKAHWSLIVGLALTTVLFLFNQVMEFL